jgi:hypothetical protein
MTRKQRSTAHSLFAHPTLEALHARVAAGGEDRPGPRDMPPAMSRGNIAALCQALEAAQAGATGDLAVEAMPA